MHYRLRWDLGLKNVERLQKVRQEILNEYGGKMAFAKYCQDHYSLKAWKGKLP